MKQSNGRTFIYVNITSKQIVAKLAAGTNVLNKYSLANPRNNLKNFFAILKAAILPLEEMAKTHGHQINQLYFKFNEATTKPETTKILNCPTCPILSGVTLDNFLPEFKNKIKIID